MTGALRIGLVLAAMLLAAPSSPTRADERVDLLLVLAADVSRSMDQAEFQLQRLGYFEALINARVIEAIRSGPHRRIAATFIEWAGPDAQKVVVDWAIISDEATARHFAEELIEAPRSFTGRTSISAAIDFAMARLERAPYEGPRRTIDISGDGQNNSGRNVKLARDDAVGKGVTINGLAVASPSTAPPTPEHISPGDELASYYRDNVIGGSGAFVMVAEDFQSFGRALINKLIAEIAQARQPRHASAR